MSDHSEKWRRTRMPQNHGWWKQLKNSIYERDGRHCQVCRYPYGLTVDHIIPLAWGGTNSKDNLQILCKLCHGRKTRIERRWNQIMNQEESTGANIPEEGGQVVGGDNQPVETGESTTPTNEPVEATPEVDENADGETPIEAAESTL